MEIFNTRWQVLVPVFKYPTKGLSVREIARKSGLSHTAVSKIIKELAADGLVNIEQRKREFVISGNFENENFVRMKRLYNLLSLSELITFLVENYPHRCCYLLRFLFRR